MFYCGFSPKLREAGFCAIIDFYSFETPKLFSKPEKKLISESRCRLSQSRSFLA